MMGRRYFLLLVICDLTSGYTAAKLRCPELTPFAWVGIFDILPALLDAEMRIVLFFLARVIRNETKTDWARESVILSLLKQIV